MSSTRRKERNFIDTNKGATAAVILGCMAYHHAWDNTTAWLYLATHGLYGLLWVFKSQVFPDKQFERPCSWAYGSMIWLALSSYWIAPWVITSRNVQPPPWHLGACVGLFAAGVFLHFVSDMQKHVHLQLQPGKLFTDGVWARCRNPNYLGELMIYAGFSALSMHWAPFVALAIMMAGVWVPNMQRKDKSLGRFPEFAAWKARSSLLIPYVL